MSSFAPLDLRTTLLVPLLCSTGAEDAWHVFLTRYWPRIVAWAKQCGAGRDDAELIASDVLLKLSCGRALQLFDRRKGSFRPWLLKVVERVAVNFLEKNRKTPGGVGRGGEEPFDALLDPTSIEALTGEIECCYSSDLRLAEAAVERVRARIRPETWEAYYRTAILENSAVETADELGLSVAAVYMAKQRVGAMLLEEGQFAIR